MQRISTSIVVHNSNPTLHLPCSYYSLQSNSATHTTHLIRVQYLVAAFKHRSLALPRDIPLRIVQRRNLTLFCSVLVPRTAALVLSYINDLYAPLLVLPNQSYPILENSLAPTTRDNIYRQANPYKNWIS